VLGLFTLYLLKHFQNCLSDEFGCATGVVNCVNITVKCDGNIDCEDGSDENPYFTDCPNTVCFSAATGTSFAYCFLSSGITWSDYCRSICKY